MRRNENDSRAMLMRKNDWLRQANENVNEIENWKASKVEDVCACFEGAVAPCLLIAA